MLRDRAYFVRAAAGQEIPDPDPDTARAAGTDLVALLVSPGQRCLDEGKGARCGNGDTRAISRRDYHRLSAAISRGDRAGARDIYYDEIIPDKRFGRGEVSRLSFRLGAVDEGDQYLASLGD